MLLRILLKLFKLCTQGPANPFKTRQQLAQKNTLSGYVEEAHVSHFNFENQRRTFHSYGMFIWIQTLTSICSQVVYLAGYAIDPSIDPNVKGDKLVGKNYLVEKVFFLAEKVL